MFCNFFKKNISKKKFDPCIRKFGVSQFTNG